MSISINAAISAYNNAANIAKVSGEDSGAKTSSGGSGGNVFDNLVADPVKKSVGALRTAESIAIGNLTKQADITEVVTALSKAESTLKTIVAVRDKVVGALAELEKMPI